MNFDLMKAFGYIERVVKFDFFLSKNTCFYIMRAQRVLSNHLILKPCSVPTLQSLLRIPKFLQLAKVFIQDENFICPHASCGSGHSKLPPDPSRDSSGQPTGHQRSRLPVRSNLTDFHYQFAWFTVYKVFFYIKF